MQLALLSLLILCLPSASFAVPFTATLYELGSKKQKPLFHFKRTEEIKGDQLSAKVIFQDLDGKESVTEDLTVEKGGLSKYAIHQKQFGAEFSLEVKNGKLLFKKEQGGKTETAEEDVPSNLVTGPTLIQTLKENWETLLRGEDVAVRYASLERKETVGFKIFKIREESRDGKELLVLKMKPSSFIIAAIVNPLVFTFDKSSKNLLELEGRALPKRKADGEWKDLDAHAVYQY